MSLLFALDAPSRRESEHSRRLRRRTGEADGPGSCAAALQKGVWVAHGLTKRTIFSVGAFRACGESWPRSALKLPVSARRASSIVTPAHEARRSRQSSRSPEGLRKRSGFTHLEAIHSDLRRVQAKISLDPDGTNLNANHGFLSRWTMVSTRSEETPPDLREFLRSIVAIWPKICRSPIGKLLS